MSKKEMQRRIESMTSDQLNEVVKLIAWGYGAHGISLETSVSLKQVNAVFQMVEQAGGQFPIAD